MNAFIMLDDVPDWQIGQEVSIYFPDTMVKKGICKEYKKIEYQGIRYSRCSGCGTLINSVENAVSCGRCGQKVNWDG